MVPFVLIIAMVMDTVWIIVVIAILVTSVTTVAPRLQMKMILYQY